MKTLEGFFKEQKEEDKKNKILIIDFHSLAYRTVFVAANEFEQQRRDFMTGVSDSIQTEREMYNYWKHLVLNNIFTSIMDKTPNKVVIAIDSKHNWRKDIYKEYKANRKESRDKSKVNFETFYPIMQDFINNIKEMFTCWNVIQVDKCEADDIIAVLTKEFCKKPNNLVELISTDGDFVQLQKHKNFKQYNPVKKIYMKSMNPSKDLEIKILTCDKSDNIPGVKNRCGPKTAEKMINEGLTDLDDPTIKEAYIRNRELISFDYIPEHISKSIMDVYTSQEIVSVKAQKIWSWMIENELNKLSEEWQQVSNVLKKLV